MCECEKESTREKDKASKQESKRARAPASVWRHIEWYFRFILDVLYHTDYVSFHTGVNAKRKNTEC